MEFDKLYKIFMNETLNEAEAHEDLRELQNDPTVGVDPTNVATFSDEEKVDYLMKHSKILNQNPNWTDNEKRAKAEYLVTNDMFDALAEPIEVRMQSDEMGGDDVMGALEQLPVELDTNLASDDDMDEIKGGYDSEQELRRREQEDEDENY
jgi:hypothetical protein